MKILKVLTKVCNYTYAFTFVVTRTPLTFLTLHHFPHATPFAAHYLLVTKLALTDNAVTTAVFGAIPFYVTWKVSSM